MKTLTLGQGFKVIQNNPVLESAIQVDESKIEDGSDVKYKSSRRVVNSSHSTLRDLSASLNLSVNVSNIAPELQAGFSQELKSDGVSSYLVLTFTEIVYTRKITSNTYSVDPKVIDELKQNLPLFYDVYGDSFVRSISYGRELTAVIQLKEQTFSTDTHGDVKANVKTTFAQASAEFHALLQNIDNSQVANIFYYVSGSENPQLTLTKNINDLYVIIDLLKSKTKVVAKASEDGKKTQDNPQSSVQKKNDEKETVTYHESKSADTAQKSTDSAVDTKNQSSTVATNKLLDLFTGMVVQVDYEVGAYVEALKVTEAADLKRKIIVDRKLLDKISECHGVLDSYSELIEYALNNKSLLKTNNSYIEELNSVKKTISTFTASLKNMASDITQVPFMTNDVLIQKTIDINKTILAINAIKTTLVHLNESALLVAELPAYFSKSFNGKQHVHRASQYADMHFPAHTKELQFEVIKKDVNGAEEFAKKDVKFRLKKKGYFFDKILHKRLRSGESQMPLTDETYDSIYVADIKTENDTVNENQYIVRIYAKLGNNFPIISELVADNLQALNINQPRTSFFSGVLLEKAPPQDMANKQNTDSSLQENKQLNYVEATSVKDQQLLLH